MSYFRNYSSRSPQAAFPPLFVKLIFIHLFEKEKRINENENALKRAAYFSPGQRPGLKSKEENRPRDFISKRKLVVSDEKKASHFSKRMFYNTVRKELLPLFNKFPRTVFLLNPLPRATFRFVPPSTLPWAKIYWPFRPEK